MVDACDSEILIAVLFPDFDHSHSYKKYDSTVILQIAVHLQHSVFFSKGLKVFPHIKNGSKGFKKLFSLSFSVALVGLLSTFHFQGFFVCVLKNLSAHVFCGKKLFSLSEWDYFSIFVAKNELHFVFCGKQLNGYAKVRCQSYSYMNTE